MINKSFVKLLNDILDDKNTSYFDIFDINKDDLTKVFDSLKKVKNQIHEYKKFILKSIVDKYNYFSNFVFEKGKFRDSISVKEKKENKAFINSLIFLGVRIIASKYNEINDNEDYINISKFNIPIFDDETNDIWHYKDSLLMFYCSLFKCLNLLVKLDDETVDFLQKMDGFIMIGINRIRTFKSLFILIWVYGIIERGIEVHDYAQSITNIEEEYTIKNIFQKNPLDPISIFKITSYSNINYSINVRKVFYSHKSQTISKNYNKNLLTNIKNKNLLENDFDYYYKVLEKMFNSFEFFYLYEEKKYFKSLINVLKTSTNFDIDNQVIKKIFNSHILKNNEINEYFKLKNIISSIDSMKKVIFEVNDKIDSQQILSFPELMQLTYNIEKNELFYQNIDQDLISTVVSESIKNTIIQYFNSTKFRNPNCIIKDISEIKLKLNKKVDGTEINNNFDIAFVDKIKNKLYLIKSISIRKYGNLNSRIINNVLLGRDIENFVQNNIFKTYEIYQRNWYKLKKQLENKEINQTEFVIVMDENIDYVVSKKIDGKVVHFIKYDDVDYFFRSYIFKENSIVD
ncbi:hypothetical protein SLITO_v1c03020 [Spiroplasma litorale]|uniref:Uncharacterized protein n=1 Tax=Spiroplasma litorale TaxID=216942 RepID=A0A0K1W1I8_9MOLU|nr:hypothetical protein [Spiroplasma litorale]AKX33957.1 hypothetical protein SLITO_v1c03020 [Spiroplasma litorale]